MYHMTSQREIYIYIYIYMYTRSSSDIAKGVYTACCLTNSDIIEQVTCSFAG